MLSLCYIFYVICENEEDEKTLRNICKPYGAQVSFVHNTFDARMCFEVLVYDKEQEGLIKKAIQNQNT